MRASATLPAGMHVSAEAAGLVIRWPGDLTLGASGGPWARVEVGGDLRVESLGAVGEVVVGGTLFVRGALDARRIEAGAVEAEDAVLAAANLAVAGTLRASRTELTLQHASASGVVFGPGTCGAVQRWNGPAPRLPCAAEGPWSSGTPQPDAAPKRVAPASSAPSGSPRWPGLVTREGRGGEASPSERARVVAICASLVGEAAAQRLRSADDADGLALMLLRAYRDARRAPPPTWLRDAQLGLSRSV